LCDSRPWRVFEKCQCFEEQQSDDIVISLVVEDWSGRGIQRKKRLPERGKCPGVFRGSKGSRCNHPSKLTLTETKQVQGEQNQTLPQPDELVELN